MKKTIGLLLVVVATIACGPQSQERRACPVNGETLCEGNVELRCSSVWTRIADCSHECVIATAETAPTTHDEGILTANETWTCEGSPHILTGPIEVGPGVELTITPGARLQLDETGAILVGREGRLVADGSAGSSILVTPSTGLVGGFGRDRQGGIALQAIETGEPSVLKNIIVERGQHGVSVGNVGDRTTAPVIEAATFRDNQQWGILLACSGTPEQLPTYQTDNQFFSNGDGDVSGCD
jgi:hypothetical protein